MGCGKKMNDKWTKIVEISLHYEIPSLFDKDRNNDNKTSKSNSQTDLSDTDRSFRKEIEI